MKFQFFLKRSIDILGSLLGIILLSWFFIIIILAIKCTSKGSAFFLQERVGKNSRVFKIIKFRTMLVNAETIGDGISIKSNRDPRITKVGRILRNLSLDELPQFFNILKGDMSLVGPRPPVTFHPYPVQEYPVQFQKRFDMRPGVTGLSQYRVRNSVEWDDRMKIDVEYIEHFSIWLDIKILFGTLSHVFKKENIYFEETTPVLRIQEEKQTAKR